MAVSCSLLIMIRLVRMGESGTTDKVISGLPRFSRRSTWLRGNVSSAVPSKCVITSPGNTILLFNGVTSACVRT
uniref:Putative secreted protein n=1 Tax=Ixodes ricinus TaxID=34613 RepID=A0A147BKS3_IXORI